MIGSIVFTGTRDGMTPAQKGTVERLLRAWKPECVTALYHGGCTGADWDFHQIACMVWPDEERAPRAQLMVSVHPSNMPHTYPPLIRSVFDTTSSWSSFGTLQRIWVAYGATLVAMPSPPLDRNKAMIRSAKTDGPAHVLACPRRGDETNIDRGRGGTLATIREAGRRKIDAHIVAYDGRHRTRL